jgi:hypothetical protein
MSDLSLSVIPATSPTLAEIMRLCQLCAGLSKAAGSSAFVLGNPRGWLGIAYHEVLEKITWIDLEKESVEAAVDRLWTKAVEVLHQRSSHHSLDRRFGAPETWPGFHLSLASVMVRASELTASLAPPVTTEGLAHREHAVHDIRERKFTAFDGQLVGRPDVIRGHEVVDYKSGSIVEFDEIAQTDVLKASYVRQLRIYAFLVKETLGWWPQRGVLLPLAGAGIVVALDPNQCTHEATAAVELLAAYNATVSTSSQIEDLASPTAQNCQRCPYKVICPPFWQTASVEWCGQIDGVAIEGIVAEAPKTIQAGAARAVSIDIERGSAASCRVQIAPLNPIAHPVVITLAAGERIRFVGLRARRDGILVPGERTLVFRVDDVPCIAIDRKTDEVQHAA